MSADRTDLESRVREYYRRVDADDIEGLIALFSPEAIYRRPGYEPICGRQELEVFYRKDRVIARGRHSVESVICDDLLGAVQGSFEGDLRNGDSVRLRFADFFTAGSDHLFTRRDTYFFQPLV